MISSTDDTISVSSGKTIIPSANSDGINLSSTLNSCREQIIPFDSIPRNLTFLILKLPGKTAPDFATTTFLLATTLSSQLIICKFSSSPTSTSHRLNLSAFGCCSAVLTSPATIFSLFSSAIYSTPSTSSPNLVNNVLISSTDFSP